MAEPAVERMTVEDAQELEKKLGCNIDDIKLEREELERHNADRRFRSRELSLAITKLDEAVMWIERQKIAAAAVAWPVD